MKRKTKNIIMSIILVLMIALTGFTMYVKSNNSSTTYNGNPNMGKPREMQNGGMGEPPEKPDGDNSEMGEPPEKPDGEMRGPMSEESITSSTPITYYIVFGLEGFVITSIILYLILSNGNQKDFKETFQTKEKIIIFVLAVIIGIAITSTVCPMINVGGDASTKNNGPMGGQTQVTYSAAKEITKNENLTEGSYSSEKADENAISISGDITSKLENITVTKTGDSSGGDNTSFYGINSAIIAKEGAKVTIKNATIETDATGANGVFSYGGSATTNNSNSDGTTITISDSKITTKKDNSGGIMTTGGGTTIASNLTIETAGTSSAAIRSDRGGGNIEVDGGVYTTTGQGSPTIYSTANISVKNATLEATASEGIVIEGKNKVSIENVTLTDNNTKLNGQSTTYKNIFLYQSMSGDAAEGSSEFSAKDSTITTKKGDSFYITNTSSMITLENNTITNEDEDGSFLRAQKDSWGNSGSNGGVVTLLMKNQKAVGNIVVDEVSTLDMTLSNNSNYEGTINGKNMAKTMKLTIDKTSTITLTGDSYVTELEDKDNSYSNINFNGYKLYVNGKAINK